MAPQLLVGSGTTIQAGATSAVSPRLEGLGGPSRLLFGVHTVELRTTFMPILSRLAPSSLLVLFAIGGCSLVACATTRPAMHVRYADIDKGALASFRGEVPLIVEFQAGDRIPVNFGLTSDDYEVSPAHPEMTLVAKRHCFVRFSADGIRTSLDGVSFDAKPRRPGTIAIGLHAAPDSPPLLDVAITAPQR